MGAGYACAIRDHYRANEGIEKTAQDVLAFEREAVSPEIFEIPVTFAIDEDEFQIGRRKTLCGYVEDVELWEYYVLHFKGYACNRDAR